MTKSEILERLSDLSSVELSREIESFSLEQLREVSNLVDGILDKERAGLDSLFAVMTHTMKFIPNLLLISLTPKYIEPPIAARICAELTVKQAVSIANGLRPEYVAEASRYMSLELAKQVLTNMKSTKALKALSVLKEIDVTRAQKLEGFL